MQSGPGARQRIPTPNPLTESSREGLAVNATPEHEEWRTIPRFEGYFEASSLGRVRSLPREVRSGDRGGTRIMGGNIRKPHTQPNGYLHFCLTIHCQQIGAYAHRLVCEAFHGPPPEGHEVRHLNGVRNDNRPENLAWGTRAENEADKISHGTRTPTKTHCKRGHPLEGSNIYRARDGAPRYCYACRRFRYLQSRAAKGLSLPTKSSKG